MVASRRRHKSKHPERTRSRPNPQARRSPPHSLDGRNGWKADIGRSFSRWNFEVCFPDVLASRHTEGAKNMRLSPWIENVDATAILTDYRALQRRLIDPVRLLLAHQRLHRVCRIAEGRGAQ